MDEYMRKWIEDNLEAGYTPNQLRESLRMHGSDPHLIDEFLSSQKPVNTIPIDIPSKNSSKGKSNIFAFLFSLSIILILLISPLLPWIEYSTETQSGLITGYETPFGLAILFVGGSMFILTFASKFLNRNFAIGIIALSVFSMGVVLLSILTNDGTVATLKNISTIKDGSVSTNADISTAYGSFLSMFASILSLLGGILCLADPKKFKKNDD